MKFLRNRRRPSPALIVAIAALSVSLVGTAVAVPIAEISLSKKEKRIVRKIARNISARVSNRRITKRAPGLAVASANTANTANTANSANTANTANSANSANTANSANSAKTADVGAPAAYAQIEAGGGIDENEPSRGISDADVTSPASGVYCVDLDFAPQTGSGNAVPSEVNEDGIVALELGAPFSTCPESAEAEVRIYDAGNEAEDPTEDIWVQFDS